MQILCNGFKTIKLTKNQSWSARTRAPIFEHSFVLVLELFSTRKILVLVRLCTRYSFVKAIEYTSTFSKGKASCMSALNYQSNFVLPRVMSKYVTPSVRLLCKYKLLTFFAVEPVPIVIGLAQSHISRCAFTWIDFATS